MKRILLMLIGVVTMFMLTNCKTEVEGKCDIQTFDIELTQTSLSITPIIGSEDNYSYTVTYSIDGTEIGKTRKAPYSITHEFSESQKTIGLHQVEIKFNGKHEESGVELYIERAFSFKYNVTDEGEVVPE